MTNIGTCGLTRHERTQGVATRSKNNTEECFGSTKPLWIWEQENRPHGTEDGLASRLTDLAFFI